MPYALLADLILLLHFAVVIFIIGGLLLIVGVNLRGSGSMRWVNRGWFRLVHLMAIGVVVAQAWLGQLCPLTVWEQALRLRAGQVAYGESFIQHWVSRVMFYDAPLSTFALIYSAFGLLVVFSWWRWPPRS
jgi:polyferredoxin